MALTVNITKIANPYKVTPAVAAAPVRDDRGRFIRAAEATMTGSKPATKATLRAKAPYRFARNGIDVVPFNGGSVLAEVYSPTLKKSLIAAGVAV